MLPFLILEFMLQTITTRPFATYGSRMLTLDLGLRRPYTWKFIVAKVQQSIIGADFLKHHSLLIDLRRIIDYYRLYKITEIRTNKYDHSTINYDSRQW